MILTADAQPIIERLERIEEKLDAAPARAARDEVLNNEQLRKMLNVSSRTLQNWRDRGVLSFSQIGNKVYYRTADVEKMLGEYYHTNAWKIKHKQ